MKNKTIVFTAILLILSIGNYCRMLSNGSIRAVEFSSIFAIGAFSGVLITQIAKVFKDKNK